MKRHLAVRPLAEADLLAIWDYTATRWGTATAEDYLSGLGQLFALLSEHPGIARERKDFRPPVRLHPYQSHLVIFTCDEQTLEVIRIVHSRSSWAELISE